MVCDYDLLYLIMGDKLIIIIIPLHTLSPVQSVYRDMRCGGAGSEIR